MKRIALLSLGLIVAVPALAIDMPPPAPIKSIAPIPDSFVRIGQGINAAYRLTTMAGQISEIWIHANCQTQDKTLLFINAGPGTGLRVYSTNSIDRYAPGSPFEPDADSLFMTQSDLKLCQQSIAEPSWAGVASATKPGANRYVDINSSHREGAMLKVRLATDYDEIQFEKKYAAPYSIKIDDVILNCDKMAGRSLASFLLDNQGRVTDEHREQDPEMTPLSNEMKSVAKALCAAGDLSHYEGTGTLILRDKAAAGAPPVYPDLEHNTPSALQQFALPAEITRMIAHTFDDPQQKPAFRSISYTQSGPDGNGPGLMAKIDAQPDGTTLTIMKMTIGEAVFYSQYQRLFNIVDVKKWEIMSDAPWVSKTLDNRITLPLSLGRAYSSDSQIASEDKPDMIKSLSQHCVAGKEWRNAAELSPSFPGRYLAFICRQDLGDGRDASSDYAYLEALNVFIRMGYQDNGQTKRFTFTDVDVKR